MKKLIRFVVAMALGIGSMLLLYTFYYLIAGHRPGAVFLWVMKTVGFVLAMGYYFSSARKILGK
jgi:hypothetical protein